MTLNPYREALVAGRAALAVILTRVRKRDRAGPRAKEPTREDSHETGASRAARKKVQAAARSAGIVKRVGWHTFRHSYSTLLKASCVDVKVIQELLRHSSSRVTLDIYTRAPSVAKREAQDQLVGLVLNGQKSRMEQSEQFFTRRNSVSA